MGKLISAAILSILIFVAPVRAQKYNTDEAQSKLQGRIEKAVDQFALNVGADQDLKYYCQMELGLITTQYPQNGFIPFGVNYNKIRSQMHLDLVIRAREVYETNFLKLCIARAMRDLNAILK